MREEMRKVFGAIVIAMVFVIAGAILFAPASAEIIRGWIEPINSLDGVTIEAGSPYALVVQQYEGDEYYKVLAYLTEEGGNDINRVNIYGYYWVSRSDGIAAYSLWMPEDTPTGKYELTISLQGRLWVESDDGLSGGCWGPWIECASYDYQNIVVLENPDYGCGAVSVTSCEGQFSPVGETENLNEVQKSVLQKTLSEEIAQRGGTI